MNVTFTRRSASASLDERDSRRGTTPSACQGEPSNTIYSDTPTFVRHHAPPRPDLAHPKVTAVAPPLTRKRPLENSYEGTDEYRDGFRQRTRFKRREVFVDGRIIPLEPPGSDSGPTGSGGASEAEEMIMPWQARRRAKADDAQGELGTGSIDWRSEAEAREGPSDVKMVDLVDDAQVTSPAPSVNANIPPTPLDSSSVRLRRKPPNTDVQSKSIPATTTFSGYHQGSTFDVGWDNGETVENKEEDEQDQHTTCSDYRSSLVPQSLPARRDEQNDGVSLCPITSSACVTASGVRERGPYPQISDEPSLGRGIQDDEDGWSDTATAMSSGHRTPRGGAESPVSPEGNLDLSSLLAELKEVYLKDPDPVDSGRTGMRGNVPFEDADHTSGLGGGSDGSGVESEVFL